jgi:glycosyltransferase involved in cell wall biosynthesis
MTTILVVGQTPPPFHGQAIMVDNLLKGSFPGVTLHHVRMRFSGTAQEVGVFRLRKLLHLMGLIARIAVAQIRFGTRVLYYVPGGLSPAPIYRDIVILLATRWLFRWRILHIHASGLCEVLESQPRWIRGLYRFACGRRHTTVELSPLSPPDAQYLRAQKTATVPNGLKDEYRPGSGPEPGRGVPVVLYAGSLREAKGILTLLEACARLSRNGVSFALQVMGEFDSAGFESQVRQVVSDTGLTDRTQLLGLRTGDEKWKAYSEADIFCFPSFREGVPLAVIEAMQFRLPVIATRWRGAEVLVKNGETGFLVPCGDGAALAEKLAILLASPQQRIAMGNAGRALYEQEYTIETWYRRMNEVLQSTLPSGG